MEEQLNLPPITNLVDIFYDIARRTKELGFLKVVEAMGGRPLKIGTICSGTERPILALQMLQDGKSSTFSGYRVVRLMISAWKMGFDINFQFKHPMSAEIEALKQAYIERNFHPPVISTTW